MHPTQQTPQPEPTAPTSEQLPPTKKSGHKKRNIILAIIATLLIAVGVTTYLLTKGTKQEPVQVTQTEQKDTNIQVGEYLEIPEMGVRLKFPSEITDAYYSMGGDMLGNNNEWAFVSTKTLKELDSGCSAEDSLKLAPAYVGDFTDPNEPFGVDGQGTISQTYSNYFKLGDKYVFYSTYQQSPCYEDGVYGTEKGNQIDKIYNQFEQVRIEGIDSPKNNTSDLSIPTDKDVLEIKAATEASCASSGGYSGLEIGLSYLQEKYSFDPENSSDAGVRFYNGYALIGISCKDEPGGYVSFMQRQSDGTYKQLLGAQDIPSCETVNKYKIPKQILPTCITNQGQDETQNTN